MSKNKRYNKPQEIKEETQQISKVKLTCGESNNMPQTPQVANGGTPVNTDVKESILERLNIQLLISVSTTTLALWWYLYNKITNFTGLESANEQMCYIFVHYIDSITLIFCLCLTAIKSYQIGDNNPPEWMENLFRFFLESWYIILALCFLAILFSGTFTLEWVFFAVIICVFILLKTYDIGFKLWSIALILCIIVIGFFAFIPSMTAIFKSVEIKTDKTLYSYSDKVYITVDVKGYACRHKLVGLGEEYERVKFYSDKGLIVMDATQIKNNEIAVATISPVAGSPLGIDYTFRKIRGLDPVYLNIAPTDMKSIREYCDFTPKSVFVKP